MRRPDAGLLATIAFMFCVCAVAFGLAALRAANPAPQHHVTFDEAIGVPH